MWRSIEVELVTLVKLGEVMNEAVLLWWFAPTWIIGCFSAMTFSSVGSATSGGGT